MVAASMAAPMDEPVRVDLPVYDEPQASSNVMLAEPLQPENRGGERSDKPLAGHLISQKLHAVSGVLGSKLNAGHLVCIFSILGDESRDQNVNKQLSRSKSLEMRYPHP